MRTPMRSWRGAVLPCGRFAVRPFCHSIVCDDAMFDASLHPAYAAGPGAATDFPARLAQLSWKAAMPARPTCPGNPAMPLKSAVPWLSLCEAEPAMSARNGSKTLRSHGLAVPSRHGFAASGLGACPNRRVSLNRPCPHRPFAGIVVPAAPPRAPRPALPIGVTDAS